ncbi:MAG: hypothetical protein FJ276_20115, partial [Planctomycetes bacterium]|nr:hypothetical protein [Planctomycetota bacterium]
MKQPLALVTVLLLSVPAVLSGAEVRPVYVVPNFHPASCGWLTDWSTERNYCANSYFDHLDRVRDDANYHFALSECNNLIAMLNFRPDRAAELQQRIREGRVELCNAFFLEADINLSGGEALVKCGVEGLRWQQAVWGVRPRLAWMIDVTGLHEQMAQITAGLGLEALAYCRYNPTGYAFHWAESPDGTRTLAISPGPYADWKDVFQNTEPLTDKQLADLRADLQFRADPTQPSPEEILKNRRPLGGEPRHTPAGAPLLVLGASGDYSLAPRRQAYPTEFLRQMRTAAPEFDVRFATPSRWLDAVLPGLKSGAIQTPTMRGGTDYCWNAFWIQCPRVKTWFRRCEQQLQAAEMLATTASLHGPFDYPAQDLHHAWLLTCLNMDRNTLWGAAGGMVFEHEHSWDARDRFEAIEELSGRTLRRAAESVGVGSDGVLAFNPLNWPRNDPVRLAEPVGPVCQSLPGRDEVLARLDLPSTGIAAVESKAAVAPTSIALPPVIETAHYRAKIDAATGSLASLVLKPGGQEVLGGPANVIVAEYWEAKFWDAGNMMGDRAERKWLADSSGTPSQLTVTTGPLATVVVAESAFVGGGKLRRTTFFYHDSPRIEFETELHDLPNATVVVAEFPLGAPLRETRRGIPYGFSRAANGITPAVRWSHYQMAGAGVALLDQGLAGRELVANTPLLFLYNAVDKYCGHPNAWLSGAGRHVLRYALLAHTGDFATARIPQAAWEFNNPPIVLKGRAPANPVSFLQTSGNVVVEALRREEREIEVRLVECLGRAGTASVTLNLPHADAALTDLLGGNRRPLPGGPKYEFPVRPQQIVTMRFQTADAV